MTCRDRIRRAVPTRRAARHAVRSRVSSASGSALTGDCRLGVDGSSNAVWSRWKPSTSIGSLDLIVLETTLGKEDTVFVFTASKVGDVAAGALLDAGKVISGELEPRSGPRPREPGSTSARSPVGKRLRCDPRGTVTVEPVVPAPQQPFPEVSIQECIEQCFLAIEAVASSWESGTFPKPSPERIDQMRDAVVAAARALGVIEPGPLPMLMPASSRPPSAAHYDAE